MSQYPRRSLPPEPYQNSLQLPPAKGTSPARRSLSSYFALALWRTLLQQAARHRYWMKGAAIAYGVACALLLGFLATTAAAALEDSIKVPLLAGIGLWLPTWFDTLKTLIEQIATAWSLFHRWLLLLGSSALGLAVWLKVVGLTQQIIRSDGDLASHLLPSLRQRLLTVVVALATASLGLLALIFVLMTLPSGGNEAIAATTPLDLGKRLFMHSLRWCLAISTMALVSGLLYRSSQKPAAKALPILPGTVFATIGWTATCLTFKSHLSSLGNQHWLLSVCSTLILAFLGLYIGTLGLLLGGQYNKLINRYFPQPRSRQVSAQTPPPSFESFTIQKRPYR